MQTFTGLEYIKIDVANQFGLDRLDWNDRIHWFNNNEPHLEQIIERSDKLLAFEKGLKAFRAAEAGEPIDFVMGLDATASGIQMMGAMSGCHLTSRAVNLVNTGHREDVYQCVATEMSEYLNQEIDRSAVKKPIMTFFYGSIAQPKAIFGEGEALQAFYSALANRLPGAFELMKLFQSFWDPSAEYYAWEMPDKHNVHIPVMQTEEKGIEVDEAHHLRFTMLSKRVKPQHRGRSLAANITHSVDGYVARMMVQMAHAQGFQLAPLHDCFYAHPNDMNQVRENYRDIMAHVAEVDLVSDILNQIRPYKKHGFQKHSNDLPEQIRQSEYALS